MPLLAFIQATTSARLPLHFHCTPDLLRYGRPREAANRSVTERPTALDVSCSAVCTLDRASRIVLSLSLSLSAFRRNYPPSLPPPPLPSFPLAISILTFCLVISFFFFSLSLPLFFFCICTLFLVLFHFYCIISVEFTSS